MNAATFFRDRPWIWIVVAFLVLIASWAVLFRIAAEHAPQPIRPETIDTHDDTGS